MKSLFSSFTIFIPLVLFAIFGIALVLMGASLFISNGRIEKLKASQLTKQKEAKELLKKTNELAGTLNQFDQERQELEGLIAKLTNLSK